MPFLTIIPQVAVLKDENHHSASIATGEFAREHGMADVVSALRICFNTATSDPVNTRHFATQPWTTRFRIVTALISLADCSREAIAPVLQSKLQTHQRTEY